MLEPQQRKRTVRNRYCTVGWYWTRPLGGNTYYYQETINLPVFAEYALGFSGCFWSNCE